MLLPVKSRAQKTEVVSNGGFTVRINRDETEDRKGWRVTWNNPNRRRKFFSDYAKAKEEARRIVGDLRAGRVAVGNADGIDLDDLSRARRQLLGIDTSLEQAVKEYKNAFHVAEEMGKSPAMVKKHYFQAVTKAEASRFWNIRPS